MKQITDATGICNMALDLLGEHPIGHIEDNTAMARRCSRNYEVILKEVLQVHRWTFSMKRAVLTPMNQTNLVQIDKGVVTIVYVPTSHPFTSGDIVLFSGVKGMTEINGQRAMISIDAGSPTGVVEIDSSGYADPINPSGYLSQAPAYGWAYEYMLPSDHLRTADFNDEPAGKGLDAFEIEGPYLRTNEGECNIRYVSHITDVTAMPPIFIQAVAHRLAAMIATATTTSESQPERFLGSYARILSQARKTDAVQSDNKDHTRRFPEQSEAVLSRRRRWVGRSFYSQP